MTEHPRNPDGSRDPAVNGTNPQHPQDPQSVQDPRPAQQPPAQQPPAGQQDWWARPSGALSRSGWDGPGANNPPTGNPSVPGDYGRPGAGVGFGPSGRSTGFGSATVGDGAAGSPQSSRSMTHPSTQAFGAVGYAPQQSYPSIGGYGGGSHQGGGTATALAPAPRNRAKRSTAVIGTTVILGLAAAFGAGYLGSQVDSSDAAAPANTAVNQPATTAPAAAKVASAGSVQAVADSVLPSVVSVVAVTGQAVYEGSGVILSADGKILTNNHVIAGSKQLTVRFNDGTTASATIVGGDATDDLAVIQAKGVSGLKAATIGSSGAAAVGQEVVAIGSPLGLSATVTSGIISALNRPVRTADSQQTPQGQGQQDPQQDPQSAAGQDTVLNAIQTDAAINHGNSGGALVDMDGKVIGINSAIASMPTSDANSQGGSIGVGFAIPIDQAKRIADEILANGFANHAVLGATVTSASTAEQVVSSGATIGSVVAGGAAEKAGMKQGDVVTKVGTQQVESSDALVAAIRSQKPGGKVAITFVRGSKAQTVSVTLGTAKST